MRREIGHRSLASSQVPRPETLGEVRTETGKLVFALGSVMLFHSQKEKPRLSRGIGVEGLDGINENGQSRFSCMILPNTDAQPAL